MSRMGLIVMVSFVIYLIYRFWSIGYKLGGPLMATGVCGSLLVVGAVGLWWAMRPPNGAKRG
ncbi:MAG: hypothetical protein KIT87_17925 [Anaerolineae bacterium]|nr:hypothetical protein [Anaerolineae bacterium]